MSLGILNACIPFFYVKNIRYYHGKKLLSYVLSEFLPILIYCILLGENFDFLQFIIVWVFFWAFYEIGYLYNDVVSEKRESKPSIRGEIDNKILVYFRLILAIRFSICGFLLFYIFSRSIIDVRRLIQLTVFTSVVFGLHNTLNDYRFRLTTLTMLGVLRTIYIPYILFYKIDALALIFLPSFIVKILDYFYVKHDSGWDFSHDRWPRFTLHLFWFIFLLLYGGVNYILTFSPILLLQIFALIRHRGTPY